MVVHYLRLFLKKEHGTTVRVATYENIELIIYRKMGGKMKLETLKSQLQE